MGGDIMHSNNSNGSRAACARGFVALFAVMLVMGLGAMAPPAEAAPFAYVANGGDNTVSVIDTATNTVVATIPVGNVPLEKSKFSLVILLLLLLSVAAISVVEILRWQTSKDTLREFKSQTEILNGIWTKVSELVRTSGSGRNGS
jgi:YVTN family beta-propeller protein